MKHVLNVDNQYYLFKQKKYYVKYIYERSHSVISFSFSSLSPTVLRPLSPVCLPHTIFYIPTFVK